MTGISAKEVRQMLDDLEKIKTLTDLLRGSYFNVPLRTVYDAVGAEQNIRDRILTLSVNGIEADGAALAERIALEGMGR